MREDLVLRAASVDDVPLLLELIRGLAVYEKLEHQVVATEQNLRDSLFGARPYAEALIAEWQGVAAGFALYCPRMVNSHAPNRCMTDCIQ